MKNEPAPLTLGVKCFQLTCTTWSVRFLVWSTVTVGTAAICRCRRGSQACEPDTVPRTVVPAEWCMGVACDATAGAAPASGTIAAVAVTRTAVTSRTEPARGTKLIRFLGISRARECDRREPDTVG